MIFRRYSPRQKRHVWCINITVDGQRIRSSGFATKQEAEEAVAALRLRQRARRFGLEIDSPEITLAELLQARKRDTVYTSTYSKKRLLGYFEDFVLATGPEVPVKAITLSHLRDHRERLSAKFKPATVRVRMAGAISALNAAGSYFPALEGYVCPRLRGGAPVRGRNVLVPRTEFLKLLDALRASDRPKHPLVADVLELLALTGARVSEILNLQTKQIDLDRQTITLHGKGDYVRVIPLSPRAAQLLAGWTPGQIDYPSLRQMAMLRAQKVGIKFSGETNWHIHDIRHTAASVLAESGTSHSVIAALLGHTLGGVTARYTHASMKALRDAVLVLEGWCKPRPTLSLVQKVTG